MLAREHVKRLVLELKPHDINQLNVMGVVIQHVLITVEQLAV